MTKYLYCHGGITGRKMPDGPLRVTVSGYYEHGQPLATSTIMSIMNDNMPPLWTMPIGSTMQDQRLAPLTDLQKKAFRNSVHQTKDVLFLDKAMKLSKYLEFFRENYPGEELRLLCCGTLTENYNQSAKVPAQMHTENLNKEAARHLRENRILMEQKRKAILSSRRLETWQDMQKFMHAAPDSWTTCVQSFIGWQFMDSCIPILSHLPKRSPESIEDCMSFLWEVSQAGPAIREQFMRDGVSLRNADAPAGVRDAMQVMSTWISYTPKTIIENPWFYGKAVIDLDQQIDSAFQEMNDAGWKVYRKYEPLSLRKALKSLDEGDASEFERMLDELGPESPECKAAARWFPKCKDLIAEAKLGQFADELDELFESGGRNTSDSDDTSPPPSGEQSHERNEDATSTSAPNPVRNLQPARVNYRRLPAEVNAPQKRGAPESSARDIILSLTKTNSPIDTIMTSLAALGASNFLELKQNEHAQNYWIWLHGEVHGGLGTLEDLSWNGLFQLADQVQGWYTNSDLGYEGECGLSEAIRLLPLE